MVRSVQDMVAEISVGLEDKLHVKGDTFKRQLRRARRRLPHKVYRAAVYLDQSAALSDNPKLARMIDAQRTQDAYRTVRAYLDTVNLAAERWDMTVTITASIAFALLFTGVMVIVVLVQRGFV